MKCQYRSTLIYVLAQYDNNINILCYRDGACACTVIYIQCVTMVMIMYAQCSVTMVMTAIYIGDVCMRLHSSICTYIYCVAVFCLLLIRS